MPGATLGTVGGAALNGYGLGSGVRSAGNALEGLMSKGASAAASGGIPLPTGPTDPALTMSNGLSSSDALGSLEGVSRTVPMVNGGVAMPASDPLRQAAGRRLGMFGIGGGTGIETDPRLNPAIIGDGVDTLPPMRMAGSNTMLNSQGPSAPMASGGVPASNPLRGMAAGGGERSFLGRLGDMGSSAVDFAERHPDATSFAFKTLGSAFGPEGDLTRARAKQIEQEIALTEARNRALEPLRALLSQQIPGTFTGQRPVPTANPYAR